MVLVLVFVVDEPNRAVARVLELEEDADSGDELEAWPDEEAGGGGTDEEDATDDSGDRRREEEDDLIEEEAPIEVGEEAVDEDAVGAAGGAVNADGVEAGVGAGRAGGGGAAAVLALVSSLL